MMLSDKQKYLMDIIVGIKKFPSGKVKQGSIKFDAADLLKWLDYNPELISYLKAKYSFELSYAQISNLLQENATSPSDSLEVQYSKLLKDENGKYSLNKTPTPTIRNIVVKVLLENKTFNSNSSKVLVKKRLIAEEKQRPADLYKFNDEGKDPVDQVITNIISSNLSNKVNSFLIQRTLIDGTNDQYDYWLTKDGIDLGVALMTTNRIQGDRPAHESEKIENDLSDKFERDTRLRTGLRNYVEKGIINACENDVEHNPIIIPSGDKYFEGHHVIPNSKSSIKDGLNTEKIENYIALCPLCHIAMHHGNNEWSEPILKNIIKIPRVKKYLNETFGNDTDENHIAKLKTYY